MTAQLEHRQPDQPKPSRSRPAQVVGVVLLALVGFGIAVSVHSNRGTAALTNARQEDLVRILDDLDSRTARLRGEVSDLQQSRDRLKSAGSQEALAQARTRADQLGILAGTVPAQGPGITVTVDDPGKQVRAAVLVDAIEELRDAGAEVLELSGIRLGADSYILDRQDGVTVDGRAVSAPYRLVALGDPPTMEQALRIPGGVVDTVAAAGGQATIAGSSSLQVRSLRALPRDEYASPAPR